MLCWHAFQFWTGGEQPIRSMLFLMYFGVRMKLYFCGLLCFSLAQCCTAFSSRCQLETWIREFQVFSSSSSIPTCTLQLFIRFHTSYSRYLSTNQTSIDTSFQNIHMYFAKKKYDDTDDPVTLDPLNTRSVYIYNLITTLLLAGCDFLHPSFI